MRTIRLAGLLAVALASGPLARAAEPAGAEKTWTAKEMAAAYATFLTEEGYRPEQLSEHVIKFKVEGGTFLIVFDETDPTYFSITYPSFWKLESEAERAAALRAANAVHEQKKVVKVFAFKNANMMASAELFLARREDFRSVFRRGVQAIRAGVAMFVEKMKEGAAAAEKK